MKKAGKNSPAPTSSGKDSHKEEVKAPNYLETEHEDVDLKEANNEIKIKELQTSVSSIEAQLQHIQSEWQVTTAVTLEVRDLLQGLKNSSQESVTTPKRGLQESNILDEEEERLRFLHEANTARETKRAESMQRAKRAKFTPRRDADSRKLESERPSYFPENMWDMLGAWEKQQCILYQRIFLGLGENSGENGPCEAEKQGLHLLALYEAGLFRSGRKIFQGGTLTLTSGLKVEADLYYMALQLAKMRQWPAVGDMQPEQLKKMRESDRDGTLLYDESYMKAVGIINDPNLDYSSKKPLTTFGETPDYSSDEGTEEDDEYLTEASKNPRLRRDSIGKRELMFKEKNAKREKKKKEKEMAARKKKKRSSWKNAESSSEEGESWSESDEEYDVKNPPDILDYFKSAKFNQLKAACFLDFEETAKRYCNYGKTANGIFEKRWHELVAPSVFRQLYAFNYMGLERKHSNVILGKVFNKTSDGGPPKEHVKHLMRKSIKWDDGTRYEHLEYESVRGLALLQVMPKDNAYFVTTLEEIMRDRWPSKERANLKKIHTTDISNIIQQHPTYTSFLNDYLAVFLLLQGGVRECVERWGLDKYDIPWEGQVGLEKSMAKTFKELGNETLLVIMHMVVADIKEQGAGAKKKVSLGFEKVMNGVNDWFNQEYQLAQDSGLLDKKKEVMTQRFFAYSPPANHGRASSHLEVLDEGEDGHFYHRQGFQDMEWYANDNALHQESEAMGLYVDDEYAALYSGNVVKGRDWKSYCYCKIFGKPCSGKCKKESDDPVDGLKAASFLEHQQEEKIKMLTERLVAIKAFKQAREKELKQKNRYDPTFSVWPRGPQVSSSTTVNRQGFPSTGSKPSVRPPPKPPYTFAKKPGTGLNLITPEQQQSSPLRDSQQKPASDEVNQGELGEGQENETSELDEFSSF